MVVAANRARNRRERGLFSFIEILLASLILALSATATAYWVETVNGLNSDSSEQTVANSIVKIVTDVIGSKAFREPSGTGFGAEAGESLATFDDLDDFDGLVASPPFGSDLKAQSALSGWTVKVEVTNVGDFESDPSALEGISFADSGANTSSDLRAIRVTVLHGRKEVATTLWLRARSPFE